MLWCAPSTGSLSKFPVPDHPEVLAAKGDAGFVVLEGPAGSVRRAAAAFRRQDATPVTTPLADQIGTHFPTPSVHDCCFCDCDGSAFLRCRRFRDPHRIHGPHVAWPAHVDAWPPNGRRVCCWTSGRCPSANLCAILNNAADRLWALDSAPKSEGWSAKPRQGDRILTHKTLYHFRDPRRWEVGVSEPGESFWPRLQPTSSVCAVCPTSGFGLLMAICLPFRPRMNPWIGMLSNPAARLGSTCVVGAGLRTTARSGWNVHPRRLRSVCTK